MKRRSPIASLLLLLLFADARVACPAQPLAGVFSQANADYQKGDFISAEAHYRRLLDAGVESGSIYYDLGNACFKQKKLGEAIYFWEKARQKLPGDRDVRENLELA